MTRRSYSATAVPTTLVVGIGTADTSLVIADATGWPDGSAGPFTVTIKRGISGEEKVLVTTRSGTTLSGLTRGYEGTTAAGHSAPETVEHTSSKTDLDEANAHINASTGVHGIAGAVVGTTDVQTLTNKTLTGPTVDAVAATGLTGSVQPTRFVGGTVSGAPTTGAHLLGDFVIDQTGLTFICTVAGTPGTWVQGGSAAYPLRLASTTISAAPASANTNDRTLILGAPADFSNAIHARSHKILNANTLGTPTTGYHYSLETAAQFRIYDTTTSGHNESLSTPVGRTGATVYRTMLYHGGQGDAVAYNAYVELYSTPQVGSTHWLANAAGVILNGDVGVSAGNHQYLNAVELNCSDGGFDSAAIGIVLNFNRTNATASQGEVWMGVRLQSGGTQPIDVGYSITGPAKRGLDLSQATFDTNAAAITLAAGQRIYFGSTTAALNGVNWYATTPGTEWLDYNSTLGGMEVGSGGATAFLATGGSTAVNYLKVAARATGLGPRISAEGTDTNISFAFVAKGTGGFNFQTAGGTTQFFVSDTPSASRFVRITGSTLTPTIETSAGDLGLNPATGKVQVAGTQVLVARRTGWVVLTGTADRATSWDTSTITTAQLAQRVKALTDDLITHGLIGA